MDKNQIAVSIYNKIADIYTKKYFDDRVDIPYIDKFLSYLSIGSRVLEVGCGPGQFVEYLIEKGYASERIDLSEKMIEVAKKRVPQGFARVLKPNGYLLIIAQKGEPDRIVDEPLKIGEKMFINLFTKDRLTKFLTDAGFKIKDIKEAISSDPNQIGDNVIYTIVQKTDKSRKTILTKKRVLIS